MFMNIIGLGNLAQTLAKLFIEKQLVKIGGIYNRTEENARKGINFLGEGTYFRSIQSLPAADVTFITTKDDFIPQASLEYSLNLNIQPGSIIVHCSGVMTASSMDILRIKGCYLCSVHPMHSFIDPNVSCHQFSGTFCAVEGDEAAVVVVSELFKAIGARLIKIASVNKPLYHAAGVIASNYLLTLAQQALKCLNEAQVEEEIALELLIELMKSTISNLAIKKAPKAALTGPLKRGDAAVIDSHLQAFTDETTKSFYKFMLDKTRELIA